MKIIGGNAADPFDDILATHGLDDEEHIPVRIATNDSKKRRELCLDEPPIESELSALKRLRRRDVAFGFLFMMKVKSGGMRRGLALHRVNRVLRTVGGRLKRLARSSFLRNWFL